MGNYHVRFGKGCLYSWANTAGYKYLVHIRLELASPGVQFLQGDHQLFNVIISAHAFIMIFFMVKIYCYIISVYNYKFKFSNSLINYISPDFNFTSNFNSIDRRLGRFDSKENKNNLSKIKLSQFFSLVADSTISDNNNNNNNDNNNKEYIKFYIKNPLDNRKQLAEVAKNKKGIYIFEILNKNLYYIGSSINLYSRICSYFMPSILIKADRRVLRYFRKYGFKNVNLILYIMKDSSTIREVLKLEEYYINKYTKNKLLNIEMIPGSGYHLPMSEEARNKLRKLRGQPFYLYDNLTKSLIFMFDSKQFAYNNINLDHRTLDDCLYNGKLYLNRFMFTLEPLLEFSFESLISLDELKFLIKEQRYKFKNNQPASKIIYVENIYNSLLNEQFNSISEFAKSVKGDRGTIRNYLNGKQTGLYRGQWKITLIKNTNFNN